MTKTMTAAAALLLGVAVAASAQANSTMRQSAAPTNDTQQTAQTGTTAAPQVTKKQTTRKLSKQTARRQLAAKRTGHKLTVAKMTRHTKSPKFAMAKLTRHTKLQQTARLHHRALRGQQQSSEIGSSTMPSSNTFNTAPTTAPLAGSGSSTMPQDQNTTLQNQQLQNPQLNPAPIR